MKLPVISILGKPNVGKSTLFNRLLGKRKSIVSPTKGVTRDRIYGTFNWLDKDYSLIDTGGYIPKSRDVIDKQVNFQAEIAKESSDLILFVVDSKDDLTASDRILSEIILKTNKPYIFVVNKVDKKAQEDNCYHFFELGLSEPVYISAQEGRQVGLLLDLIHKKLLDKEINNLNNDNHISLAIIGMPNVGKSSLMNKILDEEKSIVTNIAGTTRDSVDSYVKYFGNNFRLIDTAGLRKKSKIDDALEFYSTVRTSRVIEECNIAAILIDAKKGFHAQDKNIINDIIDRGKGLILIINKWDLIDKQNDTMNLYKEDIIYEYPNLQYFPILFMSVKHNLKVRKVLEVGMKVSQNLNKRIKTNELNNFLKKVINSYPPPSVKGKDINIKYMSQLKSNKPLFVFFTSYPELIPESYKRYLKNQIYENFDFEGVAIKLTFKRK